MLELQCCLSAIFLFFHQTLWENYCKGKKITKFKNLAI